MIDFLNLECFKCFNKVNLPLGGLTLLSGENAAGKSSIIHAFLLLNQSVREHEWSPSLFLNGERLHAGTAHDVIDKVNGRKSINIGIEENGFNVVWRFSGERDEMSLALDLFSANNVEIPINNIEPCRNLVPRTLAVGDDDLFDKANGIAEKLYNLRYISAERIGPKDFYSLNDNKHMLDVGSYGENTVCALFVNKDRYVNSSVVIDSVAPVLFPQVQARLQQFFPNCEIVVTKIPDVDIVTLGVRNAEDTNFHRPMHVGFGITQVLPIIVSALSAKVGDLLIIENPEVHLHPRAQSLMGQFLSIVAASGVQVIVESHSDHVLNGIRRAVKSNKIAHQDVCVHFFQNRNKNPSQIISPSITKDGNIDLWPKGFFDQFDDDLGYFAGWGD